MIQAYTYVNCLTGQYVPSNNTAGNVLSKMSLILQRRTYRHETSQEHIALCVYTEQSRV